VRALGGFGVVKDVLAEDFVLGRMIPEKLGKRVVLARAVVRCMSVNRSTAGFVRRYSRWSVMQHQCAGLPAYVGLLLLNPLLLATAALLASPGGTTLGAWLACAASRVAVDAAAGQVLRGQTFPPWALTLSPIKDLLVACAWLYGLTSRRIEWRSHRLTVLRGSVLRPEPRALAPARGESGTSRASATA
jgi:ceramide glucosyltransferase